MQGIFVHGLKLFHEIEHAAKLASLLVQQHTFQIRRDNVWRRFYRYIPATGERRGLFP
jgi:hypothetical protein